MSIFNTIKNGQPFYYGYEPSPNPEWAGPTGLAMMFSSKAKSSKSSDSSSESSSVGVRDVPSLYGDSVIQQQAIQIIESERNKFINKWTGKYKEYGGSYSKFIKKFSEEISEDASVINLLDTRTSMNEPKMAENQNIYMSYKDAVGEENAMQIAINPDTGMPYFTNINSDGTKVSILKDNGKTQTHSDIIHSMYERGAGINPNTGQLNTLKTPYVVKNPSEIINSAFATVLAATKSTKKGGGSSFTGAEMSPSARAGFGLTNDDIIEINVLTQSKLQDAQKKGQKISYEQANDYAMQTFYSMNPEKGSYNEYIYHRKSSVLDNREQLGAAISNFHTMIKSDANLNSAFNTMFYTYLDENNGMMPVQYLSEGTIKQYLSERTIKEIQNNPSFSKYLIKDDKGNIHGLYVNLNNLNMKSSADDAGFLRVERVMKEAYMNMWLTEKQQMSTQYESESDMTMSKLGSYGGAGAGTKQDDIETNSFLAIVEGTLPPFNLIPGTDKVIPSNIIFENIKTGKLQAATDNLHKWYIPPQQTIGLNRGYVYQSPSPQSFGSYGSIAFDDINESYHGETFNVGKAFEGLYGAKVIALTGDVKEIPMPNIETNEAGTIIYKPPKGSIGDVDKIQQSIYGHNVKPNITLSSSDEDINNETSIGSALGNKRLKMVKAYVSMPKEEASILLKRIGVYVAEGTYGQTYQRRSVAALLKGKTKEEDVKDFSIKNVEDKSFIKNKAFKNISPFVESNKIVNDYAALDELGESFNAKDMYEYKKLNTEISIPIWLPLELGLAVQMGTTSELGNYIEEIFKK